jgi:hypothetical protein
VKSDAPVVTLAQAGMRSSPAVAHGAKARERFIFESMAAASTSVDLDAAIIGSLPSLYKEQKEAILHIIEAFTQSAHSSSHWDDPDFVAEMDRRFEDYKNEKNISSFKNVEAAMDWLKSGKK